MMTSDGLETAFAVNVLAPYVLIQELATALKESHVVEDFRVTVVGAGL